MDTSSQRWPLKITGGTKPSSQGCTAYIEQMRAVISLAGSGTPEVVPAKLQEALVDAFRDFRRDGAT